MAGVSGPLKWFGGKSYLSARINALMPPHLHYVEPFFGGGTVLLGHDGANRSELVNDLHGDLINFWRVLRDPGLFQSFLRACQTTPLARDDWEDAGQILAEHLASGPVERAWAFFVFCRQSRAGQMTGFTSPTRTRLRRGMNGNVSEWLSAIDGLPAVHCRLQRVMIEDGDALVLIAREDTPDTLFYLDPPYLHETRTGSDEYLHEMTREQHVALLNILQGLRGKFLLSGYHSELYDQAAILHRWTCHEFTLPNNAAGGEAKRRMVECVWCNF